MVSNNSLRDEVIYSSIVGKKIKISSYLGRNYDNLFGDVVLERTNSLIISISGNYKVFLKNSLFFEIEVLGKPLYMDARLLFSTLQTRLKKLK